MTKNKQGADAFIVTKDDGSWDLVNDDVMAKFAIKANVDSDGSKQIKSDGFDYNELLEPLYNPEELAELLEINTFHAQCCDVVSRDAAGKGYTLNPVTDTKKPNENHKKRVREWIDSIAPNLNKLLYQRHYDRRALGYGVLEVIRKDRAKSEVIGLGHIASQHLRRHNDGIRVKQQIGTETVWFIIYGSNKDRNGKGLFDVNADTGEVVKYNSLKDDERANELLWQMDYTPKSVYYGLAKVVPAIRAVNGDLSRSEFNASFFRNYGMPTFAVTVSGDFVDYDVDPKDPEYDETKTLKWKISQQIKGVIKNPHSAVTILVPSEGEEGNVEVKLQPLSVETKEASFKMYRKDNRDEVLVTHRVPGYRIGINETGGLGGSNTGEATKIYKMSVIEPLQADDEADLNLLITEQFGKVDYKFEMNEIDVRDMAADILIAEKMFNMTSIKPKEIRAYFGERFNLEEDKNPYLDEYYLNGKPLDVVWGESGTEPPGTSAVLGNLQDDLLGGLPDDSTNPEDPLNTPTDGNESRAIKNAFDRLRSRVQTATSSRRSIKE